MSDAPPYDTYRVPFDICAAEMDQWDAGDRFGLPSKKVGRKILRDHITAIQALQYRLYAENKRSVLVVLQGRDAAGKDGTIRNVFGPLNPQGVPVTAFKKPSSEELDHDYLWRIHKAVPGRGEIGVFNRSHYEDVLVVRVHNLVEEAVWRQRYEQINAFEKHLAETGTTVVKIYLHIDRDEQKERLQARLDDPTKLWKFNPGDLEERALWDDYTTAFSEALGSCSTPWAPWYVVPANRKWARNVAIAGILRHTLESMDLQLPEPTVDPATFHIQ